MIGFNHYVRINESRYHNEYWNMQKGQYQVQCQYSFSKYEWDAHTPVYMYLIGKTLFSLYLSYLYQIKCPRIYFKCCIHEIEIYELNNWTTVQLCYQSMLDWQMIIVTFS